jgi:formylglycine-generating enzyme required for sulfatase activity
MMSDMATRKGKRVALAAGAVALVVLAVAVVLGWPHLLFWYRFEPLGKNAQGYPEYKHRQTGIVMVLLPGGTSRIEAYTIVANGTVSEEGPVEVTLSLFLFGKSEVTVGQWKAVMGEISSNSKDDDDRPIEIISWEDIKKFSGKTGLLPSTSAQWHYASNGGEFGLHVTKGYEVWCADIYGTSWDQILPELRMGRFCLRVTAPAP